MKHFIKCILPVLTLSTLLMVSCSGTNTTQSNQKTDSVSVNKNIAIKDESIEVDNNMMLKLRWLPAVADSYLRYTQNSSIRYCVDSGQKDSVKETYLWDQLLVTDTAKYIMLHIGHDVAEADGSNQRFATDGWIYIDTTTRIIYEYDDSSEVLIKWKR